MRPRIAITADLGNLEGRPRVHVPAAYAETVCAAGGEPILLPPPPEADDLAPLEDLADGLLLAGGDDLDTAAWGEPLHPSARPIHPRRQRADLGLVAMADLLHMPVLGVCLGMQEMVVVRGGRIIQHLPDEPADLLDHGGGGHPPTTHDVRLEPGTLLARLLAAETLIVNSRHHQAVRDAGHALHTVARAPDGVVEAVEDATAGRFFLGVQWHPEDQMNRAEDAALVQGLCGAAGAWRSTR